jgi:hypothetical protein
MNDRGMESFRKPCTRNRVSELGVGVISAFGRWQGSVLPINGLYKKGILKLKQGNKEDGNYVMSYYGDYCAKGTNS